MVKEKRISPRCLGKANPPYGCGHFREHQEAARKGWATRRGVQLFKGAAQQEAIAYLYKAKITHAHEHPSHAGVVRFRQSGQWYELPIAAWNEDVRVARRAMREEVGEARYRARKEKEARAEDENRYKLVVRRIRQYGGIRPYRKGINGKVPELEEWRDLPRSVKTLDTRRGFALDDMAQSISAEFGLRLEHGEDLARYLQAGARRRR